MPYHKAFHSTVTCLQPPLLLFYCVFFVVVFMLRGGLGRLCHVAERLGISKMSKKEFFVFFPPSYICFSFFSGLREKIKEITKKKDDELIIKIKT